MNNLKNLKLAVTAITLYDHLKRDVADIEKTIGELDDTTKNVIFSLLKTNIKALIEVIEEVDKEGDIFLWANLN